METKSIQKRCSSSHPLTNTQWWWMLTWLSCAISNPFAICRSVFLSIFHRSFALQIGHVAIEFETSIRIRIHAYTMYIYLRPFLHLWCQTSWKVCTQSSMTTEPSAHYARILWINWLICVLPFLNFRSDTHARANVFLNCFVVNKNDDEEWKDKKWPTFNGGDSIYSQKRSKETTARYFSNNWKSLCLCVLESACWFPCIFFYFQS